MGKVQDIEWSMIEKSVRDFTEIWDKPDMIVGVSRGGIPIAVALSYLEPTIPISFALKTSLKGNNAAFYVFDEKSNNRTQKLKKEFYVPDFPIEPRKLLIVDDVSTYGDTLEVISDIITNRHPNALISYYCFAADRLRLGKVRPHINTKLSSAIDIDNKSIWLNMPWQVRR